MPSDAPAACARRSTNHAPALCRVAWYSLPGLPMPTIKRNGVMVAPVYHAGSNKKARREPPGGPSCAGDGLLLVVLLRGGARSALVRTLLATLVRSFLACLAGFHRRGTLDGARLDHCGDFFHFRN